MKTLAYRTSDAQASSSSLSPKAGRIRKTSQERRERKKIEDKLRHLVGHSEEGDQLDLLLCAIERIRHLQQQLQEDKENDSPIELASLFEKVSTTEPTAA